MHKNLLKITIGLFLFALTSCKTTPTNLLFADQYDKEENQTILTLLPYGNIAIPGQWTKTTYNPSSRQHFFINKDTTSIAVTKNSKEKYPFFKSNQTDYEFVTAFVNWDTEYWEQQGLTITLLESQPDKNYQIWQAKGTVLNYNTLFLYGVKNNIVYNFSGTSNTWTEATIKDFLVQLFDHN